MKFKRDNKIGKHTRYPCIVEDCLYDTYSAAMMYDHLKRTHNFYLFEERHNKQ